MLTSKPFRTLLFTSAMLLTCGVFSAPQALALDVLEAPANTDLSVGGGLPEAMQSFSPAPQSVMPDLPPLPSDPLATGARAYLSGDVMRALPDFERAAQNGHALALWKLGKIYATGDGVKQDDFKAFQYFAQIANRYADENPHAPRARVVSDAFVALGDYYLNGIAKSPIKADPRMALNIFTHAASYFGAAEAQYKLAHIYINGIGLKAHPRLGAKWLSIAAKNNHSLAQAELGLMLVEGQDLPKSPVTGLMWMAIAANSPNSPDWLAKRYNETFESLDEYSRAHALSQAQAFVERQAKR